MSMTHQPGQNGRKTIRLDVFRHAIVHVRGIGAHNGLRRLQSITLLHKTLVKIHEIARIINMRLTAKMVFFACLMDIRRHPL
jgi:hypothetical protein